MKNTLTALLFASTLASTSMSIEAAGFRTLTITNANDQDLTVGLWYPSEDQAGESHADFGLPVAQNAPISVTNSGLILISHGFGGWYGGHADTAIDLAERGFLVAAPSHAGNTWSDMSSTTDQWALDRPRQISQVIDHLLDDKELTTHIDPDKIGVYGFSAGGYTALGLIGGIPDLEVANAHCQQQPDEIACSKGIVDDMRKADMQSLSPEAWGADPRIKAAAISAPGLGFSYTKESLGKVTAAVQLWSGELDEDVPTKSNAALVAERLPEQPETHWVSNANHFAFLIVPCRDKFKQHDPIEYKLICSDAEGFERREFHTDMHREMARFFKSTLEISAQN